MIFELAKALNAAHFYHDGQCVACTVSNNYEPWGHAFDHDGETTGHEEIAEQLWVRKTKQNYEYAISFLFELLSQYIEQNGYPHIVESSGLYGLLKNAPQNIPTPSAFSQFSHKDFTERRCRA